MFKYIFGSVAALALIAGLSATVAPKPAQAGCVTGALVGGIAGHFLGGHGLAGAAAGCAGGALMKRHQQNQYRNQPQYNNNGNGQYNRPDYNR